VLVYYISDFFVLSFITTNKQTGARSMEYTVCSSRCTHYRPIHYCDGYKSLRLVNC